MKTAKTKKSRKTSKFKNFIKDHSIGIIVASCLVIALIVGVMVFALPSYKGSEKWVRVPQGATEESVGDSLRSSLGDSFGNRVFLLWKLQGGDPRVAHGIYRVEEGMTAGRVSHNIKSGRQTPVKVSFNGVRTMDRLAERVTKNLEMTPEQFLDAVKTYLYQRDFSEAQFPAAFLPDSYEFYWTVSPGALVEMLVGERDRFWTPERIQKAKAEGLTPNDIAVVASIVEEESAKRDEWPTIARLYLNRLHRGMPLQADPTVKFATVDPTLRRITGQHLKIDSPYNTYIYKGLPPGPIRIVERMSLEAVLDAPKNDYLYMCAKEDFSGYHNFTSNYSEHLANARRYQDVLNRKGIK